MHESAPIKLRDILIVARSLIADKAQWCQGVMACDADCGEVDSKSSRAVRWCAVGALEHVTGRSFDSLLVKRVLIQAAFRLYRSSPVRVNDCMGHDAVLAVYDAAIAGLGEAG